MAAVTDPLLAAAELVDDLAAQRRREDDAYRLGYRDGFTAGEAVGAQRTERELTAVWDAQAAHVGKVAALPVYADLERVRWGGPRESFGTPRPGDFPGFGAAYEPSVTGDGPRRRGAA